MHEVAGVWHPAVQRVLWGSYVGGDLDGGRGASRMLAQLSRFGMNVATVFLMFLARVISNGCAWQKQHIPQPLRD
jgi:hypothetical protein